MFKGQNIKAFKVTVKGYDRIFVYWAHNAGQARYKCYCQSREAGYTIKFEDITLKRLPEQDSNYKENGALLSELK